MTLTFIKGVKNAQHRILLALMEYGSAKIYTGHKTTRVYYSDGECAIFGSQNNVIGLLANGYATNGRKQRRYFPTYGPDDTWKITEKGLASLPRHLRLGK